MNNLRPAGQWPPLRGPGEKRPPWGRPWAAFSLFRCGGRLGARGGRRPSCFRSPSTGCCRLARWPSWMRPPSGRKCLGCPHHGPPRQHGRMGGRAGAPVRHERRRVRRSARALPPL